MREYGAHPFESWFRDYARAFDRFDGDAIAGFFHCPCLMVSRDAVVPLTTEDGIRTNMRGLLAYHREQGVGSARVLELSVKTQTESLAIVGVRWQVFERDGSLLWDWWNSYNLVDHGPGWKIVVSTTH